MFGYDWGNGGEGEGTADNIVIRDRAGDFVRFAVDVWDLFVAASSAPSFSREDIAGFVAFDT